MAEKRKARGRHDSAPRKRKGASKKALEPEVLGPESLERRKSSRGGGGELDEPEALDAESSESEEDEETEVEPAESEIAGSSSSTLPSVDVSESDIRAISPSDPLRRYMEEVRRHPLLDPEEEFKLAMRLKDTGDIDAAKKLVQANLRLVVKIAFEYRNYYSNLLDLVQEGNIGLMKAVSKFDPTRGARLGYYSSWWIRSYILKYLLDNFRLVKIGTTQAQKKLFYHLLREKERLEAQGLFAGPKLLAEKLEVREKDVVEMEQRLSSRGGEISIDAPVEPGSENPATFSSFLADKSESPDETMAREQLLRLIEGRMPEFQKTLNEKEQRLLRDRILSEEPKTLQEVADLYGLTRERARQIEVKVIQKLREFLSKDLGPME